MVPKPRSRRSPPAILTKSSDVAKSFACATAIAYIGKIAAPKTTARPMTRGGEVVRVRDGNRIHRKDRRSEDHGEADDQGRIGRLEEDDHHGATDPASGDTDQHR